MVTVSQNAAGRHFVSFTCEVESQPLPPTTTAVGVDLGLTDIVTLSTGWKSGNPRIRRQLARKLKRAQRVLSRRRKGSGRWQQARITVARIQAKIADTRRDFLHKLSTALVRQYGVIAIEDLDVNALCRALRLGKSMADAALGELRRQLIYKAQWADRQLLMVNRWARSTGVCPETLQAGEKLSLSARRWTCRCCQKTYDRDVSAAQVILQTAVGRTVEARGAGLIPVAV